jgi:hypothetical protein
MHYRVLITHTDIETYFVEAASEEEAERIAVEKWQNEEEPAEREGISRDTESEEVEEDEVY